MDENWGCDTEAMDELVEWFLDRAEELRRLIELLRSTAQVDWRGPDAASHRARTEETAATLGDLAAGVTERAGQLARERDQQLEASSPDAAGGGPGSLLRGEIPLEQYQPMIGGPLMADPEAVRRFTDRLPPIGPLGPLIGGPLAAPGLPGTREPLPAGEEFALREDHRAAGEATRRDLLGLHPLTSAAQLGLDLHERVGGYYDAAERGLEAHGLGALTPALSLARVPHALGSAVLGESSPLGQVTGTLDSMVGNARQTTAEVADAIGTGDVAGAIRAGERGAYRHAGDLVDLATTSPLPAVQGMVSEMTGIAADAIDPFDPQLAGDIRAAGDQTDARFEELGRHWEHATDGETLYDARRRAAPLPWDPRESA